MSAPEKARLNLRSATGPGCVKSRTDAMIFFELAGGSDGCQALWKGLTEANAHFSLPLT